MGVRLKHWRVPFSCLNEQFDRAARNAIYRRIDRVAARGDFTLGREVAEFEKRVAGLIGPGRVVGVNSGTDALKIAMMVLGVKPGDEVITAANTFIATCGAIVEIGAKPGLVDIGSDLCIDPDKIEAAIGPRTKAIIPVHFAGHVCDMVRIVDLAAKHDLVVIEDACQALGASRDGTNAGAFGDASAFSLHPLKSLNVWGDGGFICFPGETGVNAEAAKAIRNHGMVGRNDSCMWGVNSRLDTIHAAVALVQLPRLGQAIRKRRRNAHQYDCGLFGFGHVNLPNMNSFHHPSFHLYIAWVEKRDKLIAHLHAHGVEAKVHYPIPPCATPMMAPRLLESNEIDIGTLETCFPMTMRAARETISLPIHQHLTKQQIAYVCETVKRFY